MGWPEVVIGALNVVQVIVLAVLALYDRRTSRRVTEVAAVVQNGNAAPLDAPQG